MDSEYGELQRLMDDYEITCDIGKGAPANPSFSRTSNETYSRWNATFHAWNPEGNGRQVEIWTPFYMGSAHADRKPSAVEIFSSLLMDADADTSSFENFCADYGYGADSREAYEIFQACAKIAQQLRAMLGSQLEEFLEANRDI